MKQSYKLKSGLFEITLTQQTRDTGTVSVSEKRPKGKPKVSVTKLYGIRATDDGIICKADLGFFDPVIELVLESTGVRVDAPGQSHDKSYPATPEDIGGLREFLAACGFPKA